MFVSIATVTSGPIALEDPLLAVDDAPVSVVTRLLPSTPSTTTHFAFVGLLSRVSHLMSAQTEDVSAGERTALPLALEGLLSRVHAFVFSKKSRSKGKTAFVRQHTTRGAKYRLKERSHPGQSQ
jgi:hypothetical protein